MLTAMTEEDWTIVLQVFDASQSRRGDKGRDDRRFLEALHYFVVHNITWRALPEKIRTLEQRLETVLAIKPNRDFRSLLRCAGGDERDGASGADVRLHRGARACFGGRRKRGQNDQALGRSRGGFSTKIHLEGDLDGLPLAFHLTGGEASDSRNFVGRILLDLGPTSRPALPSRIRDTMQKPIAMAPANAAFVRSSHTNQTRSIDRHSFRKYSTRRGHASSRPSANSSASNASRSDARRPRKTTLPSYALALGFILIKYRPHDLAIQCAKATILELGR